MGGWGERWGVCGVNGVRVGGPITITPVTKVDGTTFHIAIGRVNTNLIIYRVVDSGKVRFHGRGALQVLRVRPGRCPLDIRVVNNGGSALIRTTGCITRGARTTVVSVGVNYPIDGIVGTRTKTG